jgi:hypothetical protein
VSTNTDTPTCKASVIVVQIKTQIQTLLQILVKLSYIKMHKCPLCDSHTVTCNRHGCSLICTFFFLIFVPKCFQIFNLYNWNFVTLIMLCLYRPLGCNTVKSCRIYPTFRRKILISSSWSRSKRRRKLARNRRKYLPGLFLHPEDGSNMFLRFIGEFLPAYTALRYKSHCS